ncbi:ABC transporter substrate-binding protein [Paenibacillus alkalitolerans]|uniref:ABC transporter substrate-binding protein n=1 Tax=Paenibacillus alkalitolerans TaxID=2799335 RepID=UPI0018F3F79C|nr:sugar ABC transporter substrate-binding protein [Paenibacillus alkalitolerans]
MVKKWLGTTLAVMLAFAMAACSSGGADTGSNGGADGGGEAANGSDNGGAAKEKVKLQYWTIDRHDADYIERVIKQFNETNKDNIEVEIKIMADNYAQTVDMAYASKQTPDILKFDPNFMLKGYLEPLDEYVSDEMKAKFDGLLHEESNMLQGKIYSLPNSGSSWRLIYNKELFAKAGVEPPKTLDEMVETAKKLTEAGKADGAYGIANNFKSGGAFHRFGMTIGAVLNGTMEGYDYKSGQFDFSVMKPITEAYRQMFLDGSMIPGVETLDIDPMRALFAEGKIGMYVNHSGEPGVYKNQFPSKIEWAAAPLPSLDGTVPGASLVRGGTWLAISKESKHKEEAWKFLEYMYGDEVLTGYFEGGFGLSIVPSVLAKDVNPDIPGIEGFLPSADDALYPPHPTGAAQAVLEGPDYQVELTKYIFQGGDLDKIIADLNERYIAALKKARDNGDTTIQPMPDFDVNAIRGALVK